MKVLVTGGGGYIGVVLCERLLDAGHDVRVLDRLYWGRAPLARVADRVEIVQADVRAFEPSVLDGVDAIAHLAGLSNDPTAEYNPQANWEMNADATERLAAAAKRHGIRRFSFGSSASIYDGLGEGVFDETAPVQPRGAYSKSKFAAEEALLRGTLFLHGGGWMWRPLVDVTDVAEAHLRVLEADPGAVGGEIFNVVHDNFQIRQLAMLVAGSLSMYERVVKLEDAPMPAINRNYRCANRKLQKRIGFTPQVTVLESIEGMLKRLPLDDPSDLAHPRFYNIKWMTLLEEVVGTHAVDQSVWSTNGVTRVRAPS
ncbi:MAG TPA: NAD(P)-dependent oxidoreductase [Vicinamibacterales bacterium]